MSKKAIIGRKHEQAILDKILKSQKAEFLALYGRRRVGKTYLIKSFYNNKSCVFFNANGIKNGPMNRQLTEFTKEVSRVFYQNIELKQPENWFDAFELLLNSINSQVSSKQKIILFLDEFPWMVTHRSKLLEALDFYWNRHFSTDPRIKLVICGSSASWIIKHIVNNKGGLHNRLTQTILLEPFNLLETRDFLRQQGVKLNNTHISQVYMAIGGIPYYLSHVNAGLSATQIIQELAFTKGSFFLKEFDNLFSSLFNDPLVYINLVRTIATKKYGLSQEELFQKFDDFSKGGTIVSKLRDLENTGFITSFIPYKNQKKGIFYRVIDEYSLFYFNWIEPIKATIQSKGLRAGYWQKIQKTAAWYNWAGYAFEAICYKHLNQISSVLNLSPTSIPSSWRYTSKKGENEMGTQIDLLFARDDQAITICEIKYTETPFAIDKSYAEKLKQKISTFKKVTRIDAQYFLVMICSNGLKKTLYSEELIDSVVTLDDLFINE